MGSQEMFLSPKECKTLIKTIRKFSKWKEYPNTTRTEHHDFIVFDSSTKPKEFPTVKKISKAIIDLIGEPGLICDACIANRFLENDWIHCHEDNSKFTATILLSKRCEFRGGDFYLFDGKREYQKQSQHSMD